MSKKTLTTAKQRLIRNRWWVLAVLAIIALVGFGVYRDYSIKADKEKFEKAQASIDALYADIVAKVGEPAKTERSQSCGYGVRKYEKGPLSCGDYLYFVYAVNNHDNATELTNTITEEIDKDPSFNITFSNANQYLPFLALMDAGDGNEVALDFEEIKTKLSCGIEFTFARNDNSSHSVTTANSALNLSGAMACQGDAKAEHYPAIN